MALLLGYDVTSTTTVFPNGNRIHLGTFTAVADGTAEEVVIDFINANNSVKIGLYDASDNLLASGELATTVAGDNTVTLSPQVAIASGTSYKIGFIKNDNDAIGCAASGGQTWGTLDQAYANALPDPITTTGTATLGNKAPRVFVQGTLGAGGPSITSMTDPVTTNSSATITGTAFGATQGSSGVTQEGIAVTETAWSDTSITFDSVDIESSSLKYGTQTFEVITV